MLLPLVCVGWAISALRADGPSSELDTGFQKSGKRSASEPASLARCAICFRRKIGHELKESIRLV